MTFGEGSPWSCATDGGSRIVPSPCHRGSCSAAAAEGVRRQVDLVLGMRRASQMVVSGMHARERVLRGTHGPKKDAFPKHVHGKARNLARDPRVTCLVETGDDYFSLRGVQVSGLVRPTDDPAEVTAIGTAVVARTMGLPAEHLDGYVAHTAPKRRGYLVEPVRTVSWDHRKLAPASASEKRAPASARGELASPAAGSEKRAPASARSELASPAAGSEKRAQP